MANNEQDPSSKKEDPIDPNRTKASIENGEDRYQNKDQAPAGKDDEKSDRVDERYMRRSRSRDDRRGGMWGYKSWDATKSETGPDLQDPVKDHENDRGSNQDSDAEDGPTSMGKWQKEEEQEGDDR